MWNSISDCYEPKSHLPKIQDEFAEATNQIQTAYCKVIEEFRQTMVVLKSSKKDTSEKKNCLEQLVGTIDGFHLKLKVNRKKFFSGRDYEFSKRINCLLQSLYQDLPNWTFYESLREPFLKLKSILEDSNFLTHTQDFKSEKLDQIAKSGESQMQVAQQQLNLIKEIYDLTISNFDCYLKGLQTQSSHCTQAYDLELVINTALVQIRSIQNKFPQDFSQYLDVTLERMKQDFSIFRKAIPDQLFCQVHTFIEKFEEIIDPDRAKEKSTSAQQNKKNSHKSKGQEEQKVSLELLQKCYEPIKKSMLDCLRDAESKKTKSVSPPKIRKLSDYIKAAEKEFRLLFKGQFSWGEHQNFLAVSQDIRRDWDTIAERISVTHWNALSPYYLDFKKLLENFNGKV